MAAATLPAWSRPANEKNLLLISPLSLRKFFGAPSPNEQTVGRNFNRAHTRDKEYDSGARNSLSIIESWKLRLQAHDCVH